MLFLAQPLPIGLPNLALLRKEVVGNVTKFGQFVSQSIRNVRIEENIIRTSVRIVGRMNWVTIKSFLSTAHEANLSFKKRYIFASASLRLELKSPSESQETPHPAPKMNHTQIKLFNAGFTKSLRMLITTICLQDDQGHYAKRLA